MKSIQKLNFLILFAAMVCAALACKKEEDVAALPSLNGSLTFYVPEYVSQEQTLTMIPKGAIHPAGGVVGYSWKVLPSMSKADTTRYQNGLDKQGNKSDGAFTHTFSDTLKQYSVTCNAFASGYASLSSTSYVNVVKGGLDGSITGTGIKTEDARVSFQNSWYYLAPSGTSDWFRNNLERKDMGAPYMNLDVMTDVFGRYYSYDEALNACPEGYRLPTDEDWVALCSSLGVSAAVHEDIPGVASVLMADVRFNGEEMWQYTREVGDIEGTSRMAMFPAGYANLGDRAEDGSYPEATFDGLYDYAVFWTADAVDGNKAYYRYLVTGDTDLLIGQGDRKNFGAMVRCVSE